MRAWKHVLRGGKGVFCGAFYIGKVENMSVEAEWLGDVNAIVGKFMSL